MWGFVASLLLALLYPGSLLLPAIFGFLVQLSTAFFGTVVGDWVDANPRMRGKSWIVENVGGDTPTFTLAYSAYISLPIWGQRRFL